MLSPQVPLEDHHGENIDQKRTTNASPFPVPFCSCVIYCVMHADLLFQCSAIPALHFL